MTSILIDHLRESDTVFVFSDGMITTGHSITTTTSVKSKMLEDGRVVAFCGICGALEIAVHILEDTLEHIEDNYAAFQGDCCIFVADSTGVTVHNISQDDGGVMSGVTLRFENDALPVFYGSGGQFLAGAYEALEIKSINTEKKYLTTIKKAYEAHSKRVTSAGPLFTTMRVNGSEK